MIRLKISVESGYANSPDKTRDWIVGVLYVIVRSDEVVCD